MSTAELAEKLKAHESELRRLGVERLSIFGSHARGEAGESSDVDVLVKFHGPATFSGYMDLKFFLEDLWERKVDLVTEKAVRPELRERIEREAIRVA